MIPVGQLRDLQARSRPSESSVSPFLHARPGALCPPQVLLDELQKSQGAVQKYTASVCVSFTEERTRHSSSCTSVAAPLRGLAHAPSADCLQGPMALN